MLKRPIAWSILLFLISSSISAFALNDKSQLLNFPPDIIPPITECILDGEKQGRYFVGNVTLSLVATDDESGVRDTWLATHLGGGAMKWEIYHEPITISNIGEHKFDYWSIDNVGNREDTKTISFIIIEDIGYLIVVGNITETVTSFIGDFKFMFFIGLVDKEFNIITIQDEYLILEKRTIIKELITTSKVILVKVAKLP